jgi:hypothetical protein
VLGNGRCKTVTKTVTNFKTFSGKHLYYKYTLRIFGYRLNIKAMTTLKEQIKNDPYLKINNCMDESDLLYALERISELRRRHPESRLLRNMYFRFEYKKLQLR